MLLKDQEQNVYYRWAFGYLPSFIFVCIIILTISYFMSSYLVMSPRAALDEWSCNGKIGSEEVWNKELNNLQKAKQLDPWNADIYMDLGRMYEWKALSGSVWNSDVKGARAEASYYFKQATIHRPTWALAWANYAQSQLLNRVVDNNVLAAISNGFKYGRWQEDTYKKLLFLSIGMWKNLPEDIKVQAREQIRVMQNQKNYLQVLTRIAVRFQWFDELIPIIENKKDREYLTSIKNQPTAMKNILGGESDQQEFVCRVDAA